LSVKNLDKTVAFYQKATNVEVIERKTIRNNITADSLFATTNVELEVAVFNSHQMLF
jgi:catechol-2,3-dioxygenase